MIRSKQQREGSVLGIIIAVLAALALVVFVAIRWNITHQRLTTEIAQLETELKETHMRATDLERRLASEQVARQQAEGSLKSAEQAIAQMREDVQSQQQLFDGKIRELEEAMLGREERVAALTEENVRLNASLAQTAEQAQATERELASMRDNLAQLQPQAQSDARALASQPADAATGVVPARFIAEAEHAPSTSRTAAKQQFSDDNAGEGAKAFDTPPKPVDLTSPEYPRELKQQGTGGMVTVSFTVDTDGRVRDVEIQDATDPAFGEAATAAVRQWRFKPAMRDGRPVEVRIAQKLRFNSP